MKFTAIILTLSFSASVCAAFPTLPVNIPIDTPINDYLSIATDIIEALNVFSEGYTPEQEYYLGRSCAANILKQYSNNFVTNTQQQEYVNQIGQSLAVFADRTDLFSGYIFIVVESPKKNALAAPGGFIFITTGMIQACENEDQIAGILAHEIAHVVHKDAINSISERNRLISLIKLADKYGGEIGRAKAQQALDKLPSWFVNEIMNISVESIFSTITDEIVKTFEKAYGKEQEKQADLYAVYLMAVTGYNPEELSLVIAKLNEGTDSHYGSHPSPSERISYIDDEISRLPSHPATSPVRTARIVK
ncbi:M48 family metalloprotease [candidate division WOR-3 bacterium]|nr:M48 family metalloprotease [candidate division WOR-3 bacterium]